MEYVKNTSGLIYAILLLLVAGYPVAAGQLETAIDETLKAHEEASQSQQKIDALADDTKDLVQEYKSTLQKIDSLRVYNNQLEILIKKQDEQLLSISRQLRSVEETQRNIVPLMLHMIEVLEKFIALDLPFLQKERQERIKFLNEMMNRPDVSLPEKYRRIMEAYQIEMEYGRTIEASSDTININGHSQTVDVLRVGRIALVYQTLDGETSGHWDVQSKKWITLPDKYDRSIAQGIKIARKQAPPDLFKLPLPAPQK